MIRIYVKATDTDGKSIVEDIFDFVVVPRIGERVILDNRGGCDEKSTLPPLVVTDVVNYAEPKGDVANPRQYVDLICRAIG